MISQVLSSQDWFKYENYRYFPQTFVISVSRFHVKSDPNFRLLCYFRLEVDSVIIISVRYWLQYGLKTMTNCFWHWATTLLHCLQGTSYLYSRANKLSFFNTTIFLKIQVFSTVVAYHLIPSDIVFRVHAIYCQGQSTQYPYTGDRVDWLFVRISTPPIPVLLIVSHHFAHTHKSSHSFTVPLTISWGAFHIKFELPRRETRDVPFWFEKTLPSLYHLHFFFDESRKCEMPPKNYPHMHYTQKEVNNWHLNFASRKQWARDEEGEHFFQVCQFSYLHTDSIWQNKP